MIRRKEIARDGSFLEVYVAALLLVGPRTKGWMSVLQDDCKSDGRNIWNRELKCKPFSKLKCFVLRCNRVAIISLF